MCDSKMRNISREMETMRKNQMKNLQLKNKISEGKKKKKNRVSATWSTSSLMIM